jgi:hypothetical protein
VEERNDEERTVWMMPQLKTAVFQHWIDTIDMLR